MRAAMFLLAACSAPVAASSSPPSAAAKPAPSAACTSAEHRQFDFWIGTWDVTLRVRKAPTSEEWGTAKGTQHIESILGDCALEERFSAEGPLQPWAGRSYSSWQAKLGKWRQTWVDDQGGYIALTGGLENGVMTLYAEPATAKDGTAFQMRMVFLDVTPRSLRWEWQRSTDAWKSSTTMMRIDYVRR